MELPSKETLNLLYFLLPGFVAAWVFYGLTAHPKKDAFERIVQALIFTFIIKAIGIGLRKIWWMWWHPFHTDGVWTSEKELVGSLIAAGLLGLVFAIFANWDVVHRILRYFKVTKRTSYPSEWYSGFHRFRRDVILHLSGERRLRGWADEWPDQCDKGHFLMQDPEWIDEYGKSTPLSQVKRLMIPASDVERIEFLCDPGELTKTVAEIIEEQKPLVELHLMETANAKRNEQSRSSDITRELVKAATKSGIDCSVVQSSKTTADSATN